MFPDREERGRGRDTERQRETERRGSALVLGVSQRAKERDLRPPPPPPLLTAFMSGEAGEDRAAALRLAGQAYFDRVLNETAGKSKMNAAEGASGTGYAMGINSESSSKRKGGQYEKVMGSDRDEAIMDDEDENALNFIEETIIRSKGILLLTVFTGANAISPVLLQFGMPMIKSTGVSLWLHMSLTAIGMILVQMLGASSSFLLPPCRIHLLCHQIAPSGGSSARLFCPLSTRIAAHRASLRREWLTTMHTMLGTTIDIRTQLLSVFESLNVVVVCVADDALNMMCIRYVFFVVQACLPRRSQSHSMRSGSPPPCSPAYATRSQCCSCGSPYAWAARCTWGALGCFTRRGLCTL